MEEPNQKDVTDYGRKLLNPFAVRKPKKRSLVERELETNMTARMISPVTVAEGANTSRYGRARLNKSRDDSPKAFTETLKSPKSENVPVKFQSPIAKLKVSSHYKTETPQKALKTSLDNINNICQDNKTLSRFSIDKVLPSSTQNTQKVYIRQDLIQNRDDDDDNIVLIKDLFSSKSSKKKNKVVERSAKKTPSFGKQNGHIENASVVKALDFDDNIKGSSSNKRISDGNKNGSGLNKRAFDGNKKIKESNNSPSVSKNELSSKDTISYEEGDLVWARMGTFPFWPCIVTKDPESNMFIRKKLFGRVVHDILHVTYFADNGRRSWVVDNMLRKYVGLEEFLATREKFTSEDKKKDPRLYSAFFISEKKQSLWNTSVEEAEMINREPKSLRIDVLNDLLHKIRASKKQHKSGKISRTNSDVSLSESLYDSLFSEDDSKTDDANRSRNKSRNKSLDVSDVVTACLDNMAVKTGNIKIQKQSHMDRWLQKAKSKTPEKVKSIEQVLSTTPVVIPKTEIVTPSKDTMQEKMITPNVDRAARKVEKLVRNNKKKKLPSKEVKITKIYSLRRSYETQNSLVEETETKKVDSKDDIKINIDGPKTECNEEIASGNNSKDCLKPKVELLENNKSTADEDNDDVLNAINELLKDTSTSNSKNISSKPLGAIADPLNKTEVTELQIDIKPEIMDMDENPQNTIQDTDKLVVIAEDILESPIKVEKELTINDNLCSSMILDCDSPVKTENETSVERRSTNEGLEVEKNAIQEECTTKILDVNQQSPTLKGNEMVSIPENAHMTDDDCDSVTSMEYSSDVLDLQDSNIVVSTPKKKHDGIKSTENPNILIKNIDIEQPGLSNKRQDHVMLVNQIANKDVASTTKQDILIENRDIQIENHDLSKQKQDNIVLIDKIENKDTASTAKQDILIEPLDIQIENPDLLNKKQDDTKLIDEIENKDIIMSDKDLLNTSGTSESILQIDNDVTIHEKELIDKSDASVSVLETDVLNDAVSDKTEKVKEPVDSVAKYEIIETCKNNDAEEISTKMKSDENTYLLNSTEPKSFLGDGLNIDVYKDTTGTTTATDNFFLDKNIDKPPDLTTESLAAKTDLLKNVQNNDSDYDEESDDEPSPEYEPLGDDISEDFRQHMKCIVSSITDKKDEAQLVKVCNEIAVIEESKSKLIDIKKSMNKISPNTSITTLVETQNVIKGEKIKAEDLSENNKLSHSNQSLKQHIEDMPTSIKPNQTMNGEIKCDGTIKIDLTKTPDQTKETKAEILDGLNIIKKAAENSLKSPSYKKKHNLSLKKEKSLYHEDSVNPLYKTIDQIEEIIKSKPKRLPIDNFEVRIPEIKENGYYAKSEIDTPDRFDDDFDIDEASVNSEDSEVSLNQEKMPSRRSLRSRPAKQGGLQDPEFLNYMELRQDDLMEEHPELSLDDIVLYLYKTYTYSKNIESDEKLEELASLKSIKQETPSIPSRKKSKKSSQPKNTIENFFRVKYNNAKRLDFDSESGTFDCSEDTKPKRETRSVSSSDSGIGNSKDSNESNTSISKRKSITKDVKVEVINDAIIYKEASSPKTPKRLRKKTISPRVASLDITTSSNLMSTSSDKRVPVVVISPMKDNRNVTKHKNKTKTRHETITDLKQVSITELKQEDAEVKHERVNKKQKPDVLVKHEPEASVVHKPDTMAKRKSDIAAKHAPVTVLKLEPDTLAKRQPDNIAKRKLETATKHKPDSEAKYNSENVPKHELITTAVHESVTSVKHEPDAVVKHTPESEAEHKPDTDIKHETESVDSDSELPLRKLRSKVQQDNKINELKKNILKLKVEIERTPSISSDNEPSVKLLPLKADKSIEGSYEDPEFVKYVELKQDNIMEENPQLSNNEITAYLYKTWIYEKNSKSDMQKHDDIVSSSLVKGLDQELVPAKKTKRKPKIEKNTDTEEIIAKDKPKRKTVSHYYNEAFISDYEDELEVFELFKAKKTSPTVVSKPDSPKKERVTETKTIDTDNSEIDDICQEINTLDEIELYFKQLTSPKPSVFKGLIREKVCEICEDVANLIKCKGCYGTFHYDCVTKVLKTVETPTTFKGRKKKKKVGRKPKNHDDSDQSDERDVSIDTSIDDIPESITIDADTIESQLAAKMMELLDKETQLNYDSYSSDDGIDWTDTVPGKCELVDVKLKKRTPPIDYTNFKCNNCQKFDTPICFVCKSAVSKNGVKIRQKCNAAHCYSYFHLKCLDHWPQTQFNTGELTRSQKKTNEQFEAFTCPRHVCHTCVSDDPRGCKTRFSGDKLAKCVRCPATYHSFNKCLPAGTQILTASFIICPRHYEHRPGKVPCHVNTGWCFICALGGSLICCEYCPTSFHAECLNIKPPEGNYMCEDCETGRLPLYEEMVWVKLGHYRWWPGVILHPSEIPDNIMAVKHGLGEFVVRFFGQYDHYWVNRGRVFPYQEGDSGRISSQKSKIDVAFTTAMEHAQRAFEILKNAEPDEDESLDIASSLLPPAYVKLKSNKPIGSLLGRKTEDPSLSLTQCECSPAELEPCGSNSECINRMLLTECGPTCRAGDRCGNRAFEKRQYPKLTPYKALHRGWGLKTLEDIKAGQFVIEYVGELIDEEEFQRRMARQHEIRDENFYFLTLDKERMIDAGPKGNLARFMNHCCEPNCETQKWTVLGDIRVGLFAINDIKANSEVTFNYNLESSGIEKKRCLCGAKRCSGYIGAKPKQLDESHRKKNVSITGKRKYTKRKNIEDSPSTVKNKSKKPLGRPPKTKELTEIEKDLLIIKNATPESSGESPRRQSVEEKNLKPLKKKMDSNTMEEGTVSSTESSKLDSQMPEMPTSSKDLNIDSNLMQEVPIPNGPDSSSMLKRKLDLNTTEEVTISCEPSVKRQKRDKSIEVGD